MKTQKRRRMEGKTDYQARFNLLKSGNSRFVVRKTNRYIIVQIAESEIAQDKIIARASSKELLEKGWPKEKEGSLKSLQAAYLTGFLLAKKVSKIIKHAVLDSGINRNIHGSRIYAALNGALGGGLKIPHSDDALPSEERLKENTNLFKLMQSIKEKM